MKGMVLLIYYPFFYDNIKPYPVFHDEPMAVRVSARLTAGRDSNGISKLPFIPYKISCIDL